MAWEGKTFTFFCDLFWILIWFDILFYGFWVFGSWLVILIWVFCLREFLGWFVCSVLVIEGLKLLAFCCLYDLNQLNVFVEMWNVLRDENFVFGVWYCLTVTWKQFLILSVNFLMVFDVQSRFHYFLSNKNFIFPDELTSKFKIFQPGFREFYYWSYSLDLAVLFGALLWNVEFFKKNLLPFYGTKLPSNKDLQCLFTLLLTSLLRIFLA